MKVLFFNRLFNEMGDTFNRIIEEAVPAVAREIFVSFDSFHKRLTYPFGGTDDIIVLYIAEDLDSLIDLISIRYLLFNIKLILIVPDDSRETVGIGHELHPRFLASLDDDFSLVVSVLKNMMEQMLQLEELNQV